MIIYPAIDIKDGKCVRLTQGEFSEVTVYSESPVEMALKWELAGAKFLHVIDLDGARLGTPQNIPTISEIAVKCGIPIQFGGGVRTIETIENILSKGVSRVILGTSAVTDPQLVKEAIALFGSSLAIGIDAREGMVAIEGWATTSKFTATEFAKKMEDIGAKTIIYTDITRDGMLKGPNFEAMEEMLNHVQMEVIASGGVSSLNDVKTLKEIGMHGAIIGKALYTGDVNLAEALKIAEKK